MQTAPTEAAPVPARSVWRPALLVGAASGLVVFVWLVLANRQLIASPIIEEGDFAANSILVDRAEQFRLLVGNYSRVGFNHPGPALLYAQAFGDMIVHRWLGLAPSSYSGQFTGILALNSFCIGAAAGLMRAVSGRWTAALALVALVPVIHVWQPYALATTWMPGVYIAPFLLLVVAAAAVAGAHWGCLWALIAGASLCVHGHVSFVMFAGLLSVLALVAGFVRVRRGAPGPRVAHLIWAGVVLVLFLSPLVVNLVLHWPGEFDKYLQFVGSDAGFVPRTAGDVAGFTAGYWLRSGWWMVALYVVAIALTVVARIADPKNVGARFRLDVVLMVAAATAAFAFYAARGVDNLSFDYVGWFILAGPLLVLWAGLDAVFDVLERQRERVGRLTAAGVAVVLAAVLLLVGVSANPYRGLTPATTAAMPDGDVRLTFTEAGWPAALGLVENARREGHQVCVEGQSWALIVTPAVVCTPESPGEPIEVLGPSQPRPPQVIFDDGYTALVAN